MKPYLLREPIGQYESLRGYAIRIGALNQSTDLVSPHLASLSAATEALATVASLTAVDEATLASHMSQQSLGEGRMRVARLGQASIGHRAVRWQERFVCPACVKEGVLSNILWELDACMVCCTHELMLASHCNGCRKQLRWESAPLDSCSCGQSLGDLECAEAPAHEVLLSLHLRACALSSLGGSVELEMPDQAFTPQVSLDALLLFLEFGRDAMVPTTTFASPEAVRTNAMLRTARKTLANVACEPSARLIMSGRVADLPSPVVLGARPLSDRDLVELKWMFAGEKPAEEYPLLSLMASRRQRWQGIAPALVIAEPRDWSRR